MADVGGDAVTWWVAVYGAVVSTLAVLVAFAGLLHVDHVHEHVVHAPSRPRARGPAAPTSMTSA
jgi:hypothetical protein